MYQGKSKKKGNKVMWLYALSIALLLLSVCTTGVFAYLKLSTEKTDNSFNSAQSVNPIINETFDVDKNIKKNVKVNVKDTGYSVYVRAAFVVTWQDSNGNVYVKPPKEGEDYSIDYGDQWEKRDDYWYYKSVVESGKETDYLITECKPLKEAPVEGYTLNVKIMAQTIQSAGFTDDGNVAAKTDVWN